MHSTRGSEWTLQASGSKAWILVDAADRAQCGLRFGSRRFSSSDAKRYWLGFQVFGKLAPSVPRLSPQAGGKVTKSGASTIKIS